MAIPKVPLAGTDFRNLTLPSNRITEWAVVGTGGTAIPYEKYRGLSGSRFRVVSRDAVAFGADRRSR